MNYLITIFFLITTLSQVQANQSSNLSIVEQEKIIIQTAKELRRDFWVAGHQDVNSYEEKVTLSFLNDYVKEESNRRYDSSLNRNEISELYQCFHRAICELYFISVSSEYYSGYGETGNFILLNIEDGSQTQISHTIYAE